MGKPFPFKVCALCCTGDSGNSDSTGGGSLIIDANIDYMEMTDTNGNVVARDYSGYLPENISYEDLISILQEKNRIGDNRDIYLLSGVTVEDFDGNFIEGYIPINSICYKTGRPTENKFIFGYKKAGNNIIQAIIKPNGEVNLYVEKEDHGMFVINVMEHHSADALQSDKSYKEIKEAYHANKTIIAKLGLQNGSNYYCSLQSCTKELSFLFGSMPDENGIVTLSINPDGNWSTNATVFVEKIKEIAGAYIDEEILRSEW